MKIPRIAPSHPSQTAIARPLYPPVRVIWGGTAGALPNGTDISTELNAVHFIVRVVAHFDREVGDGSVRREGRHTEGRPRRLAMSFTLPFTQAGAAMAVNDPP